MKTSNKEIQDKRMRGYFVEATKKILKGEGLKSISVRNVANEAGYSYATLYNYFKDVKELVFECIKDFEIECEETIKRETSKSRRGIPKIKAIVQSYMKFFVQYPGIFELFYLEKINVLGYKNPSINLVYSLLDSLSEKEWDYCIAKKIYSKKEVETKKELLKNTSVGVLLFYLNRFNPNNYKDFTDLTNRQLNAILL